MIKKRLIITAFMVVFLGGLLILTGCAGKGSPASSDSSKKGSSIDVMITIEYPEKSKIAGLENIKFPVEENSTALQAIELFCSVSDIPCYLETTSNTIVGINTVMNGDFNKNKVWMFSVGDGPLRTDATEVRLKNGDSLKWTYEEIKTDEQDEQDDQSE